VAHETSSNAAVIAIHAGIDTTEGSARMEWVLLEAALALALGLFIVWWLMRGKK
jgi:hypothetical protein